MRRWAVVGTLLQLASAAAAAQAPYRATWWDAVSATSASALAVVPAVLKLPRGLPSCAPCNPGSLPGIDHAGLTTFSDGAGTASSVLLAGVIATAGFASMHGLEPAPARGNAAVLLNSLAWTGATTQWLKVIVRRNRPILYTANAPAAASQPQSRQSFPSGHAALAFAAATSYLAVAKREHRDHTTRNAVLLYAGAAGVSVLRVAAGKHFPTDVAAGAVLGSGVAWLVSAVHASGR